MKRATCIGVLAFAAGLAACTAAKLGPYESASIEERHTSGAEALNPEAAEKLHPDPKAAEALQRDAPTKDLLFGPPHNYLGVVHLKRGELYEAASEFEWTRNLLLANPDPCINLAITLERAGRAGGAMDAYKPALEVRPGLVIAMQGAAVPAVRAGRKEVALDAWLREIAISGESAPWGGWTSQQARRNP